MKPIKTQIEELRKGCGKAEINSKTGNVSIYCGDTLDERLNHKTGETEFLNYLCQECKAKLQTLKELKKAIKKK